MTIDERIEGLTERHEALAESIELMRAENEKTTQNVRILATVTDQNKTRATKMMEAIASLARTEAHQRRLD